MPGIFWFFLRKAIVTFEPTYSIASNCRNSIWKIKGSESRQQSIEVWSVVAKKRPVRHSFLPDEAIASSGLMSPGDATQHRQCADMGAGSSKPKTVVVTLDALGTIYKFKEPVAVQYARIAKQCGFKAKYTIEDLNKSFRKAFKLVSKEYPNYGHGTLDSPELWWRILTNRTFSDISKGEKIPARLGGTLYKHFSSASAYELYPDVRPFMDTISRLRKQLQDPEGGMVICGIITNSDPRVRQILNSLGLLLGHSKLPSPSFNELWRQGDSLSKSGRLESPFYHLYNSSNDFDFLATSYDCGHEKPHMEIFFHARLLSAPLSMSRAEQQSGAASGVTAEIRQKIRMTMQHRTADVHGRWIHIGDDYEKDFVGARESKYQALWLNREGSSEKKGEYEVGSLEDAAAVVALMVQQELA